MATTTSLWKVLMPYVLPVVDKCPKAQIVHEIRSAAITFCQETQIWQEDLDPLFFPEGIAEADVDPPRESRVCEIISIKTQDGEELTPGLNFTATLEAVTLTATPTVDTQLDIRAALKPTLASTGIPEGIMEDWGQKIAYGAIAALKAMRGREWEDVPGAQLNNQLFEDGMASAKYRVMIGGAKRGLKVKPRSFM